MSARTATLGGQMHSPLPGLVAWPLLSQSSLTCFWFGYVTILGVTDPQEAKLEELHPNLKPVVLRRSSKPPGLEKRESNPRMTLRHGRNRLSVLTKVLFHVADRCPCPFTNGGLIPTASGRRILVP